MKPHKQSTIFTLVRNEVSQREIHRMTGIDRKTIRKYRGQLQASGEGGDSNSPTPATGSQVSEVQNPPPWPPGRAESETSSAGLDSGGKIPYQARSDCEPHRQFIEEQLKLKRNAVAIYQELVDQHGFTSRYNSVKRFVRGLKKQAPECFDRLEFGPGEEAQVDYGEGALTRHPVTGKHRRPRLFVMTLKYSRRSFRKVIWKSSSEAWARLHEEAFRYFGGAVQYVVLDNLREGVIKPDIYEPEINRVYSEMLAHYGVVADPARVRDPNRKGTVESAIQHTQSTALQGKRFESIEEQNEFLAQWELNWASKRIHGREKRQVESMYQEEKPHLRPLPAAGFQYFQEVVRTVGDDTTVQVDNAWYAASPAALGTQVLVRIHDLDIEIRNIKTLALIRRHPRATRKGEVKLPDNERIFNPSRQTEFLLKQAEAIGPKTREICAALFEQRGREGQKSMWGVVNMARGSRYPKSLIEKACALALEQGVTSAKVIRQSVDSMLEAAIERIESEGLDQTSPLTQAHELIRPTSDYAEHFARSTAHPVIHLNILI